MRTRAAGGGVGRGAAPALWTESWTSSRSRTTEACLACRKLLEALVSGPSPLPLDGRCISADTSALANVEARGPLVRSMSPFLCGASPHDSCCLPCPVGCGGPGLPGLLLRVSFGGSAPLLLSLSSLCLLCRGPCFRLGATPQPFGLNPGAGKQSGTQVGPGSSGTSVWVGSVTGEQICPPSRGVSCPSRAPVTG